MVWVLQSIGTGSTAQNQSNYYVYVNGQLTNTLAITLPETPFGGVKESGYGSEGGTEGLHGHLVTKFISHTA